jgi:hypothetical protein
MVRGEFDVPVAHHNDRLWRTISEREAFMWFASDQGVELVATCSGDFRVGHPDDDFVGELGVMLAKREAATVGRRLRDMHESKANKPDGAEWPGGRAPYGYRLDKKRKTLVIKPAEAEIVREVVRRVLAGQAILEVVRDLHRRGVLPESMNRVAPRMRQLIAKPTIAGLRERHGELIKGKWKPIISVADHERIQAILRARATGPRQVTPSANILAGLLVCGTCGTKMHSSVSAGRYRFICPSHGSGGTGCGRVGVGRAGAEATVLDLVVAELDSPDFAAAVERAVAAAPDAELTEVADQLAADRAQLGVIADMLADGDLDPVGYKRAKARLDARIDAAERRLAQAQVSAGPVLGLVGTGHKVRAQFAVDEADGGPTLDERRAIISAVAEAFVVAPSGKNAGPRFRPERITMVRRFEA